MDVIKCRACGGEGYVSHVDHNEDWVEDPCAQCVNGFQRVNEDGEVIRPPYPKPKRDAIKAAVEAIEPPDYRIFQQ